MICRGHRAEGGIIDWSDCNIGVSNKEIDEVIKPFVLPDKCANCEYEKIGIIYQNKKEEE